MDYIDTKLQFIPQMIDMIVFVWHVPERQLRENLKRGIKIDYIYNLVLATIITINTVFVCPAKSNQTVLITCNLVFPLC